MVRASTIRDASVIHEAKYLEFRHHRGLKRVVNFDELYTWKKRLGAGAFGEVHEALNTKVNLLCAVKKMKKSKIIGNKSLTEAVKRELSVLQ